jgi:flagellar FliJ protein
VGRQPALTWRRPAPGTRSGLSSLQIATGWTITGIVETPSFTFRLERVRSLRESAEEHAREDLAHELRLRLRGEALLREATHLATAAREAGRDTARTRVSGSDLLAAQAYIERAERTRREAALDLDRREAEVAARRAALQAAARDRQAIDKLKARQRADHDREWARKAQGALDEVALTQYRRKRVPA